jgi:hypothetical protein
VDVIAEGERSQMRGRTYASVYAPSNQRYTLQSAQRYATLRGEFAGNFGGGNSSGKGSIVQNGDSFKADIYVPVWMSQLLVSDWWQPAPPPLKATVTPDNNGGYRVTVENTTGRRLQAGKLALDTQLYELGDINPGKNEVMVKSGSGRPLQQYAQQHGNQFQQAVSTRQQTFGGAGSGRLDDLINSSVALSFGSQIHPPQQYMGRFVMPPLLDLTPTLQNGAMVLLAWDEGFAPVKPLHQFAPKRSARHTLWRVTLN